MNIKQLLLASLFLCSLGTFALLPPTGRTGEFHTGDSLLCYDCHTMHFSETQGKSTTDPYGGGTPPLFPLSGSGPFPYLLRQPQNNICLSCHDGKAAAPDVLGVNANAPPDQGRQAGALNDLTGAAPYQTWKGHTLYSTAPPPGYNPSLVGLRDWYSGTTWGLKCIHCHEMHAAAGPYRNLGPNALGPNAANFQPSYVISMTNNTSKDVWIKMASYTSGSGNPVTFDPYYSAANIFFNRIDNTVGSVKTSNKLGNFCAACHANVHGGPGDANIGANLGTLNGFKRHPSAQSTIGASTYGGHSSLSQFVGKTTKVKVYTTDFSAYSNATPGCLTCHKAHGNQNPFGLIYMAGNGTIGEEGTGTDTTQGLRDLCGQCHTQN